ncbi:ABC transporter ATP-binding protein, partial [Burkholderia multivorans]
LSIANLATRRYPLHRGPLHPITAGATAESLAEGSR